MSHDRLSSEFCLDAFIRASRYFANLPPGASLLDEAIGVAKAIFQVDFACCKILGEPASDCAGCPLPREQCQAYLEQAVDSGAPMQKHLAQPPCWIGWFPVRQYQRATALLVIGYRGDRPLPHAVLETHQAVAGILGGMLEKRSSEQCLCELNKQHQMILNAAGEGIFGLDRAGNHTFVNPAAARMLGYEVEELLGQHSHSLWHHHKPDGHPYPENECPIYAVCQTHTVHSGDNEYFIHKDGGFFPVEYTSTPIMDGQAILGSVVVFKDISERRQAEEVLSRHRRRIEELLEQERHLRRLITTVSEINQLLLTADSLESLLQGSCERLAAYEDYALAWIALHGETRIYWACLSDFEVPLLQDSLAHAPANLTTATTLAARALAENGLVSGQVAQAGDESEAWRRCMREAGLRQVIALPVRKDAYSQPLGVMGVYSGREQPFLPEELAMLRELAGDIGFAVNAFGQKNALRELNQALEQRVRYEVEQRTAQEKILISQSRLAAMGEMLGAIAHQWRQPLNALALNVQDIEDAYHFGELDAAYLKKNVAKVMELVQFLSQTINDFRNFFRPDKETLRFSLSRCVHDALSLIGASLDNNSIDYVLRGELAREGEEIYVSGYPNEFKQTLLNLIGNAKDAILEARSREGCRAGQKNPCIEIRLERLADCARLSVSDDGGGIAPELLEKIFEPFFTSKEEGKGTGIGLYMAKMIVERNMGGRLYAENLGPGASFVIELPL